MIYIKINEKLISKDNEKIFNRQGRFFLSPKFRAFENRVKWNIRQQYKGQMLDGNLAVQIKAYFKNKVHCDCGNLSKGTMDACQELLFHNDNQIKSIKVDVYEKSKEEYFEIYITEIL